MSARPARVLIVTILPFLLAASAAAFDAHGLAGRSLAEALDLLRQQGLTIISSTALVRPEMMVEQAPDGQDLRAVLAQLLAPHGLSILDGPQGRLVVVATPAKAPRATTGTISGRVLSAEHRRPGRETTVRLCEPDMMARVARDGSFLLTGVPEGRHQVEVSSPGAPPILLRNVLVRGGETTPLLVQLEEPELFLNEIVVTPSHFRIVERDPEAHTILDGEDLARQPHVADDLFRAVKRLPGASGGDTSAPFNIRGGEQQELLVILDGARLYEPFHLKDFQSVFSLVDSESVGEVDLITGSFPVEYGDRMSGVMDISTVTPTGQASTATTVTTINTRVSSTGSFDKGEGQWLVNGRAWYPADTAALFHKTDNEILANYYDLHGKVQHSLGDRSQLSVNALLAYDKLGFTDQEEESRETVTARYRSHQEWLNLRTEWSEQLFSQTVLSFGQLKRHRAGSAWELAGTSLEIGDRRSMSFASLTQDWTLVVGERQRLRWGVEVSRERARYAYSLRMVQPQPGTAARAGEGTPPATVDKEVELEPSSTFTSAYLSDRFRLGPSLVVETGLRWDRQSLLDDHQLSPRINARYELGPQTTLRAGWGRFYQSQRLNELPVEDGVASFFPAQLAVHSLVSFEHRFARGPSLRVEAYHKRLSRLRPRYENLFNPLELFPEASDDRAEIAPQRGRLQGLELLVHGSDSSAVSWWFGFVLASADDRIDGRWVPRSWDQRHAATGGLSLSLGGSLDLSLAAGWHSGWPTTTARAGQVAGTDQAPTYELVTGPRNGARLPSYLRLDLRASRTITWKHHRIKLFLEIINLTNRRNLCCRDDLELVLDEDGMPMINDRELTWAPIVPTLGVSWSF